MSWAVKNSGWPLPYGDTWPLSNRSGSSWDLQNTGWPIPAGGGDSWPIPSGDSWPIPSQKATPWYPSDKGLQYFNAYNYYHDWFYSEMFKGRVINFWA